MEIFPRKLTLVASVDRDRKAVVRDGREIFANPFRVFYIFNNRNVISDLKIKTLKTTH